MISDVLYPYLDPQYHKIANDIYLAQWPYQSEYLQGIICWEEKKKKSQKHTCIILTPLNPTFIQ